MHMPSFLKKKWVWLLIAILAFGGYKYYQAKTAPPVYQTAAVERGDLAETVSVSSTLLAGTEIRLNFETGGRIRDILTAVGRQVSEGDTLARLDVAALNAEVDRAQAILTQAEASAGLSDESLREARESAKDAKEYFDAVGDAEDQKVDAADKAYDNAQDYENDAQSYYDQVVSDDGAGSATAKSAKLTLTTATNARKAADEAKQTARRNRDTAVRLARNSWNAAKERVKTLESSSQELENDSAVAAARAGYDAAQRNLEKADIQAPINGVVTQINYKKGEVIGTLSGAGGLDPFGRLLSLDFILEAKIPESDIASVTVGQQATATFDAFPSDRTFRTQVVEIDPESTVIQDVVYYKAKFKLLDTDPKLRPGMSADIDVHVADRQGVLILPVRAIKSDDQGKYVDILSSDGRTTTRQTVTTGLEGDEARVEIVSGVAEGQTIVIATGK